MISHISRRTTKSENHFSYMREIISVLINSRQFRIFREIKKLFLFKSCVNSNLSNSTCSSQQS